MGIIRDKEIRATHTQYLNDQKEYLHALSLVVDEINKRKKTASNSDIERLLDEMLEGVNGIESINVCVCSFSEERDSLSQWRAYGGSMSGFAIGFTGKFLTDAIKREECYLAPCLYEETDQIGLVSALVEETLAENIESRKNKDEEEDFLPRGGNLVAYLHRYAPILKDASFEEEKEWRIITRPLSCKQERFDFRPGNSMLIPFYHFPLADAKGVIQIHEIIVGPTPHIEQSVNSVRSFLVSKNLKHVEINKSKVPYRNW